MKILLATTMALGVVLILGANQSTNATVTQPVASTYHQSHITQAQWYGDYRYYGPGPYYYGPGPHYYGGPLLKLGPIQLF